MFVEHKEVGEVETHRESLPVKPLDAVSCVLLLAAEILEAGGHCKGQAMDGDAHCLSGAITSATFRIGDGAHAHNEACDRMQPFIGGRNLVDWNDDPERTAAEVIALMRRAALGG